LEVEQAAEELAIKIAPVLPEHLKPRWTALRPVVGRSPFLGNVGPMPKRKQHNRYTSRVERIDFSERGLAARLN
jgi:hypothetical protein